MTKKQESCCLAIDPFEGDFGNPGDKILKDKFVTARKPGECRGCGLEIQPGERVRVRAEVYNGQLESVRWCELCCQAMAKSRTDEGRAWRKRVSK